jgi:signal transduction histidine kinase
MGAGARALGVTAETKPKAAGRTAPSPVLVGGVLIGGVVVAAVVAWVLDMPAGDAARLIALSFGTSGLVGAVGLVVLNRLRRASLQWQVATVALVSVLGTAIGAAAAARAMFVSVHDLNALMVVLSAAGTIGVVSALVLGARVGRASRHLGERTRRIGDNGDHAVIVQAPALEPVYTAELARLGAELEAMDQRLAEARDREGRLEASRRELVAWVSHDLRTPLAGIRAMVEALDDGVVSDPGTVSRYYRTMQVEADRLAALVDDLFELSRIEADALQLTIERVSLGEVVSEALASATFAAESKGVRLEGRLGGRGQEVDLALPEMARVVQNLLDNAIRHTPSGGAVTVEAGDEVDHAYVTVVDSCGGIPEDELDRVFDPAFRGDRARTPGDGRGGLGLAIARGLVEAHAGEIAVRNEGCGCRFTVRLPLRATSGG